MTTLKEICAFLNAGDQVEYLAGMPDTSVGRAVPIDESGPGDLTFCGSAARDPKGLLAKSKASLVIINAGISIDREGMKKQGVGAVLFRPNARLEFMRTVNRFLSPPRPVGVHPSAIVAPSCRLGSRVYVGPGCTIGEGTEIGDDTVLHAGVHVYAGIRIGRNVTIHSGTVIGADGFGYERNAEGVFEKFPHLGSVVIEDDVEIGANTCVDRGSLGNTVVRQGVRIDNLVHVAHNVRVGRHTALIAHCMIGGSTRIGDFSWVAPSACVRDQVNLGTRSTVGLASVVTRDVADGQTVFGSPARPAEEQKKLLGRMAKWIAEDA